MKFESALTNYVVLKNFGVPISLTQFQTDHLIVIMVAVTKQKKCDKCNIIEYINLKKTTEVYLSILGSNESHHLVVCCNGYCDKLLFKDEY